MADTNRAAPEPSDPPATAAGDALLRLFFEHAAEGICMFDAQLRLQAANPRARELLQLPPELARPGTPLQELMRLLVARGDRRGGFLDVADPEAEVSQRLSLVQTQSAADAEHRLFDGRWIAWRRRSLPGGGFVAMFSDISARKRAEQSLVDQQRMLRLLIEHTEQGIWFIDNALATTDANPAMCRMLGLTLDQLRGRDIYSFVDEANAEVFREHVRRRAEGRAEAYEITLTRADGAPVHCWNNATPIFDATGAKVGAVGMFSDISVLKRAQQELWRTGELLGDKSHALELTLEALDQGVVMFGPDGGLRAWNRRAQELLELPDALMLGGARLDDLRAYQARHGLLPAQMLPQPGQPWPGRSPLYRRVRRDGTVLEVRTHEAADGSMVRTYTDVTAAEQAQRELLSSERRFRTMADAAPAYIWQSTADGRPLWFNQRWLQALGRPLEAELLLTWQERIHPDDLERCRTTFYAAATACAPYQVEFRVRSGDGWVWVEDHGIPQRDADGGFDGFIAYGWDITARKTAEASLIAARDEAERANRAKGEFLSRMSHELRTPLNAVLGFAQLLESDRRDRLSPVQRTRVQELQRGGRHLLALINDVLDLARIEAGRLQLDLVPVDAAQLAAECLQLMEAAAQERGIVLQAAGTPGQPRVQADAMRLRQVLLNLLSNAIKYNRPGGSVQLGWLQLPDGAWRLWVRDSGPGLSPEQQAQLFQPFERLGAESSGTEGAGIGLALSQWLVTRMQGRLGVDSLPGTGSTFWVDLGPATGQAAPLPDDGPATLPPPVPSRAQRYRVLYVEDNEVNRLLMHGMLARRADIELQMAATPQEGIELATLQPPDLLLLDIQLPGMDGYELLRRLRQQPALAALPVVGVSANAMPADRERAAAAGFADYITKPVDMPLLLATLQRLLPP